MAALHAPASMNETAMGNTPPMSVLFFDDDRVDRLRLDRCCRKIGLQFTGTDAATLGELKDAIDRTSFNLIFLDYHVGSDTGLDALAMVNAHANQSAATPIMATSVADRDIIIEAMRGGCVDYLVKDEIGEESMKRAVLLAIERNSCAATLAKEKAEQARLAKAVECLSTTAAPDLRQQVDDLLDRVQAIGAASDGADETRESLGALIKTIRTLSAEMADILSCLGNSGANSPNPHEIDRVSRPI